MTRARFVAGDPDVGGRFLKIAQEFTFSPRLDYGNLIEIARLRERMETELAQEGKKGRNVKLGFGGLADIEFAVQIIQLRHREKWTGLRSTNTLKALQNFSQMGIMDDREAAELREGYLFLRNLECILRLISERSANCLPTEPEPLAAIALMFGLDMKKDEERVAALDQEYENKTGRVRELYRKIIDRKLRTAR